MLVDLNATVVAAPNAPELQRKFWNPAGIVKDTLKTGLRYTRSGLVTWGEMQTFKTPYYTEKLQNSTPTSVLHPIYANVSSAENIIRWTSVPVSDVILLYSGDASRVTLILARLEHAHVLVCEIKKHEG